MFFKFISFFLLSLFVLSCSSDKAEVHVYNEEIVKEKIPCLRLVVFPPDEELEVSFKKLYQFDESCEFKLIVEKKNGITCNSSHNHELKAKGNFPTSYLKLQLNKSYTIVYSYYIDLKEDVKELDIQNAFMRLEKDILSVK